MILDEKQERARRLKQAREARSFKTAEAAAVFHGWSQHSYAQHENGIRGLTRVSSRYAKAFKVSEAWLLTGDGQGPLSEPAKEIAEAQPQEKPAGAFTIQPHEIKLPSLMQIPIFGLVIGGEDGRSFFNGEVVGYMKTPPALENVRNAYGLYVAGDSMVPRYMPGEEVAINPHKQPVYGDDVIVQLYPERAGESPEGYIKQFRGYAGNRLLLWQWNPAGEVVIERQLVKSVHVIVGRG